MKGVYCQTHKIEKKKEIVPEKKGLAYKTTGKIREKRVVKV